MSMEKTDMGLTSFDQFIFEHVFIKNYEPQ